MDIFANKELVHIVAAGSVDDGKSTLIGRLLYDSGLIPEDQIAAVERVSRQKGLNRLDFSLFTDGLIAEREQGITIDVAYRYFTTGSRNFIFADTPGHAQYTRNMVTGASQANLALILIDARQGVLEQTKRHAFISALLRVPHMVVCVNKMDLVSYDQPIYEKIVADFQDYAVRLEIPDLQFVPISATQGDNIACYSPNMPWYQGATLKHILDHTNFGSDVNQIDARFPVQGVIRPQQDEYHDYRAYSGQMVSGALRPGEPVIILPSGLSTRVKSIALGARALSEARAPQSVSLTLEHDLDVSRGDMIVRANNQPKIGQDIELLLCWMSAEPLRADKIYSVRHTTRQVRGQITDLRYLIDINTLHRVKDAPTLNLNDIGRVRLRATAPLFYDSYRRNRATGSLILIDEATRQTIAAGIIL